MGLRVAIGAYPNFRYSPLLFYTAETSDFKIYVIFEFIHSRHKKVSISLGYTGKPRKFYRLPVAPLIGSLLNRGMLQSHREVGQEFSLQSSVVVKDLRFEDKD